MKKIILFWTLAVIITIALLLYQRTTGPTYPKSGSAVLQGKEIGYKFFRSNVIDYDCPVVVPVPDADYKAVLLWKRHNTKDDLTRVDMKLYKDTLIVDDRDIKKNQLSGYFLFAELPKQPPAGKLDYYVRIIKDNAEKDIPEKEPITVRFKGSVPMWIVILHLIVIFFSFTVATRTGLEFFNKEPNYKRFIYWTHLLIILGGFVFGPLMQYYAFGEWWTGIPFGWDLTDNKMLFAYIGWIIATVQMYRSKKPGYWILGAWLLMLAIFLIPHSVFGSELNYNAMK